MLQHRSHWLDYGGNRFALGGGFWRQGNAIFWSHEQIYYIFYESGSLHTPFHRSMTLLAQTQTWTWITFILSLLLQLPESDAALVLVDIRRVRSRRPTKDIPARILFHPKGSDRKESPSMERIKKHWRESSFSRFLYELALGTISPKSIFPSHAPLVTDPRCTRLIKPDSSELNHKSSPEKGWRCWHSHNHNYIMVCLRITAIQIGWGHYFFSWSDWVTYPTSWLMSRPWRAIEIKHRTPHAPLSSPLFTTGLSLSLIPRWTLHKTATTRTFNYVLNTGSSMGGPFYRP